MKLKETNLKIKSELIFFRNQAGLLLQHAEGRELFEVLYLHLQFHGESLLVHFCTWQVKGIMKNMFQLKLEIVSPKC